MVNENKIALPISSFDRAFLLCYMLLILHVGEEESAGGSSSA